ncbi:MAG: endonuclease [Gammaproteobacteria bacterium]|nr:endonuclease [Gammaproteobacteria bacterium]
MLSKDDDQLRSKQLRVLYQKLLKMHGWQNWWVSKPPFEIIIGAILVQNTNWINVDKSLTILHEKNCLTPQKLNGLTLEVLALYIKPSGLYNQKARYLKNFTEWYLSCGSFEGLKKYKTAYLRKALLNINGIGRETADVILLYVFHRPVFIIDNYTQRLLIQLGIIEKKWKYDDLQNLFYEALPPNVKIYSEYHALIVHHGKLKHSSPVMELKIK